MKWGDSGPTNTPPVGGVRDRSTHLGSVPAHAQTACRQNNADMSGSGRPSPDADPCPAPCRSTHADRREPAGSHFRLRPLPPGEGGSRTSAHGSRAFGTPPSPACHPRRDATRTRSTRRQTSTFSSIQRPNRGRVIAEILILRLDQETGLRAVPVNVVLVVRFCDSQPEPKWRNQPWNELWPRIR